MNIYDNKFEGLELSTRMIILEAMRRHVRIEILDYGDNFIRLSKVGKTEYIKQATRTSADSYIAPMIMENKSVTKKILEESGIRVPPGRHYFEIEKAAADYKMFSKKDAVVKPNGTNFGIGVSVMKAGFAESDYLQALELAFSSDNSVIVEEFIRGKEYRFLVVGDKVVAVLHRIPANVTGDGEKTIEELVDIKNTDPLRGSGYKTPLEKLSLDAFELEFLKARGKTPQYKPAAGERIFLRNNSNISTGGDSFDITDEIHEGYKEIALKAVRAAGAKICGADIVICDINAMPDGRNYAVIELNFNPALHIHGYPFSGKNRHPEKAVLDLLGF